MSGAFEYCSDRGSGRKLKLWLTQVHGSGGKREDMALLKQAAEQRGGQRPVPEEPTPFLKSKICSNDCTLAVTAAVHQSEEVVDLRLVRRVDVTELIHKQQVYARKSLKQRLGGAVGQAGGELVKKVLRRNRTTAPAGEERFNQQPRRKAALTNTRLPGENYGFAAIDEVQFRQFINCLPVLCHTGLKVPWKCLKRPVFP